MFAFRQTGSTTAADGQADAGRGRGLARAALALVGLLQGEIGVWGLLAPRAFFSSYPGFGDRWVLGLGRYNEHLVRDYAATELGFAVLLVAAALWFSHRLVLVAGTAFLVATLPHFAYHLTATGHLSATDNVGSLAGFVVELVLVAGAMVSSRSAWPRN